MVSSNYLVASHLGAEPAHKVALEWLGLSPFLALDLRLGEGTGGLLALPIIEASMRTLQEMATFDEAVGWYAWGMVPTSGRPYWFHSLNDNATVSASYDHTEALQVDTSATPPALLAPLGVEEGRHTLAEAGEGILLLTQADTDLLTLNRARALLPEGFASVHVAQVGRLPDDEAVDALLSRLLPMAQVVIARLHANGTFSHGLERLRAWEEAPALLCPMLGPRTPILFIGNPSLQ